jgi:hypothetical protein
VLCLYTSPLSKESPSEHRSGERERERWRPRCGSRGPSFAGAQRVMAMPRNLGGWLITPMGWVQRQSVGRLMQHAVVVALTHPERTRNSVGVRLRGYKPLFSGRSAREMRRPSTDRMFCHANALALHRALCPRLHPRCWNSSPSCSHVPPRPH